MRGRPGMGFLTGAPVQFQSTPPCGGDNSYPLFIADIMISIHAPMRGRPLKLIRAAGWNDFNPRPHAGGDQKARTRSPRSIHFNPRPHAGATLIVKDKNGIHGFQSTPPCGGDLGQMASATGSWRFQSTPPCGGDTCWGPKSPPAGTFQSTPPCGGDDPADQVRQADRISIHAPMRGRLMII